jgi:hypothetical protein
MPARFVILHHRLDDGEHWDLMLEHGEVLLTWQLLREPVDAASLPIPARRIGDHRKAYLEYEGPVSGGRGTVRRVDAGTLEIEKASENRLQFRLGGSRLCGFFVLQRVEAPEWTLANLPVP